MGKGRGKEEGEGKREGRKGSERKVKDRQNNRKEVIEGKGPTGRERKKGYGQREGVWTRGKIRRVRNLFKQG